MAIRVIVLLDKGGTNTDVHHLGSISIANDGTGSKNRRNYDVAQHSKSHKGGPPPHVVKRARVEGFRSESVSVMKLLREALEALGH